MLVKVKIKGVEYYTPKATLYMVKNKGAIWFANYMIIKESNNYIVINEKLAKEKGIYFYEPLIHTPEKLEVINDQQAIKELKC